MARDRSFHRKQKDARMPVRDTHAGEQPGIRQDGADYDLRRARDAPSSGVSGNRRRTAPAQTEAYGPQAVPEMPGQAETYGTDTFSGYEDSYAAAQGSPSRIFHGQEQKMQEPYAPESRWRDSRQEDQRNRNTVHRDPGQEDLSRGRQKRDGPGKRNAVYQNFREDGPGQEDPGSGDPGQHSAGHRAPGQDEPGQKDLSPEDPGQADLTGSGQTDVESRYGKPFQESARSRKEAEGSGRKKHRNWNISIPQMCW